MKKILVTSFGLALTLCVLQVNAFCGFYVAKADTELFNNKSEVILVRDGDRTVITMSNDFKGDVKDFAMVVPVPVVLKEDQIRVVDRMIFDKLDAYSGPRLVEYYDTNPCQPVFEYTFKEMAGSARVMDSAMEMAEDEADLFVPPVTIEASYTVGEYDILILSATESEGLKSWLINNGYKIPGNAETVLEPYIKSDMKFFVVKVNIDEHQQSQFQYLSPIQIEFNSDKFMLPIRLGMANANGPQDLVIYAFTRQGRIETTNYRTVKIPTDKNIPLFVQPTFGDFYKSLYDNSYVREGRSAVFLEYAWNVSPNFGVKCDPCVGQPPIFSDFKEAGVSWAVDMSANSNVFFTRLHTRYTRDKFPQDLFFQVTPNKEHFQGRYIMTHPAGGDLSCQEGQDYLQQLQWRRKNEVDELTSLTGWGSRYGYNYIHEYSNQLKSEKNEAPAPYIPQNSDPFTGLLILTGLLGTAWFFSRRQTRYKV